MEVMIITGRHAPVGGLHESREPLAKQWRRRMSCNANDRGSTNGDVSAKTPIPARFDGQANTKRFWSHYLRVGILVFTGEAVATLMYFLLTLNGPHRAFLVIFASIVILALVVSIPLAGRFAATTWRTQFAFGWTLVAGIVAAVSVHLDRG